MNTKDFENIEQLYYDTIEEGWKAKAAGLGAAGLAAASMWPSPSTTDIPVNVRGDNITQHVSTDLSDKVDDHNNLQQVITDYFTQNKGISVQVSIDGENVNIQGPNASEQISLDKLKIALDTVGNNGGGPDVKLVGYLYNHL